jgi:hypothetical protein
VRSKLSKDMSEMRMKVLQEADEILAVRIFTRARITSLAQYPW